MWNPETHPFVVRWSHLTGDRLTRFSTTTEQFATRDEAIAALVKPFPANTSDGHIVRFNTGTKYCPMIAKRRRGKSIKILEK